MSHLFKKTLKISEDIINLHLCTKNFDMIYSSWDKEHDGLKTDWRTVLLPKTPKNQNVEKKKKKIQETISFYTSVPKITIIWCMVPEIRSEKNRTFCYFGQFYALLPPHNNPENQNYKKNFKKMCHKQRS